MSIFDHAKAVSVDGEPVSRLTLNGVTVWSKSTLRKWDLAQRRWVTPAADYSLSSTVPFAELGDDVYIYLVSGIGTIVYHSSNASRVSDVTETGFTLTNGGGGTGVGIPYRVKSGEVITLSMTKNANCQIFAAYYDANGFFHSIVSLGNVGNHLTVSDTAPIDGWVVIQFCPYNANQVVNFSNLSLSIA